MVARETFRAIAVKCYVIDICDVTNARLVTATRDNDSVFSMWQLLAMKCSLDVQRMYSVHSYCYIVYVSFTLRYVWEDCEQDTLDVTTSVYDKSLLLI